ncbi:MAG TPA: glycosyltransferase [Chryseolinea sp.]|nr:glycosyltransferase [Chryseolinea sp.]
MEKKVILMLIPNLNFGGAQRVFYNLSLELSKQYKVVECVFNFDAGHAFVSGNEVLSLDVAGGRNIFSKIWLFVRRCRKLREIKKRIGADICISHLEGADLVNVLSKGKDKTIAWVHGSKWYDQNITGLFGVIRHKLLIPFTYKNADMVVTVSKAIKEELVNQYGIDDGRITTIYNYFDFDAIVLLSRVPLDPKNYPIFQGFPILIFSGRLVPQKNPVALLKWFASFSKGSAGKLVILGDGEMRDELLQLSQLLGLNYYDPWSDKMLHGDYQLYFLGFQENPFQFIKNASVFILPSLWEGFPMALGEAMCCGLPVASADCPTGPMEMLTDSVHENPTYPLFAKFGVLLPLLKKDTFNCWTEGLLTLLNNEAAMKEYSKQSVERGMSFAKSNNTHHVIDLVENAI